MCSYAYDHAVRRYIGMPDGMIVRRWGAAGCYLKSYIVN